MERSSISVPAGAYTVTGTSAASGLAEGETDGSVTLVAGHTVTVQVICPEP